MISQSDAPNPERLRSIQARIATDLRPVRPLPSGGVLAGLTFLLFLGFSLLASMALGYGGFKILRSYELSNYLLIGAAGAGFALLIAQQIVPGAKRTFNSRWLISATLLAQAALTSILFPDLSTAHFVSRGIPCLRLGIICALIVGGLTSLLVRRGFLTTRIETSIVVGCFGGLAGFAVLALHCPI